MPDVTIIRCDGPNCEHIKGENNHWFTVWVKEDGGKYEDTEEFHCIRGIVGREVKYACGQECATKMFNSFLSTGVL